MTRKELRDKIREKVDCRDYLTKSKNGNYCCPFCNSGYGSNKTGAVKYYKDSNTCACFAGCVQPGEKAHAYDVLDLIQETKGVDYNGALEIGAGLINISLEAIEKDHTSPNKQVLKNNDKKHAENQKSEIRAREREIKTQENVADYTEYYFKCAANLEEAAPTLYLINEREISLDTAARFYIGYDAEWISPTVIKEQEEKGSPWRPQPTKRLIIPISKNYYISRSIEPGEKSH